MSGLVSAAARASGGRVSDLRLAVPALAAAIGAAVAISAPHLALGISIVGPVIGVLAVVTGLVRPRRAASAGPRVRVGSSHRPRRTQPRRPSGRVALALLAVAAAAAGLAAASAAVRVPGREPPVVVAAAERGAVIQVRLVTTGSVAEGRVAGDATAVVGAHGEHRIRSPVLVFGDLPEGVAIGSTLALRAEVRATAPGDSVAWMLFARRGASVVAPPPPLLAWADDLRSRFRDSALELPGGGAGLLPGLAVGDTTALDPEVERDLRMASLTHLTAVSGANCAIVVGLAILAIGGIGAPRLVRLIGAGALLVVFVILVTPEPSVLRASAMASLVLVATALGRPVRGIPLLSAAVLVLVIVDPWLTRDYGFLLSVLATGALLLLAAPLSVLLARAMPKPLALAVAVPTSAQIVCQPVIVLLDPGIALYGVPANLLAAPAAPMATVIGLLACVVLPLAPPVGSVLTSIAWVPSTWIAAIAGVVADLPGARLPWVPGAGGALTLAAVMVILIVLIVPRPSRWRSRIAGSLALLVLVGYAGALAGSRLAQDSGRPGDWQIAQCDVGQGDAVVVRSGDEIAVIDTGPDPEALDGCLADLGVIRISLLVITHYDLDHVGGVRTTYGRVDRALVGPTDGDDDERVSAELRAAGARVDRVARGERGSLGSLQWRVLWPPVRGVDPGNDASVTLEMRPNPDCRGSCLSLLDLGDLGRVSQRRMAAAANPRSVDVVKVAHHGSADQDPALYADLDAAVGLIGVGADNGYGHPTTEALGVLADVGTAAFRSDQRGLVLVSDGRDGSARVWSESAPSDPAGGLPAPIDPWPGLDSAATPERSSWVRADRLADTGKGRHAVETGRAREPYRDPPAGLVGHPARAHRAHLRARACARGSGCASPARHPAC